MDRMRSSVKGLQEVSIAFDWSKAKLIPVIADEKTSFQMGESKHVPIKPIKIPAYSIVLQSFYGTNGMGDLACIGCLEMKLFFEDRIANMSIFNSRIKASVLPGDLLGQVLVVPGKKAK
jgi:hypothetical protein